MSYIQPVKYTCEELIDLSGECCHVRNTNKFVDYLAARLNRPVFNLIKTYNNLIDNANKQEIQRLHPEYIIKFYTAILGTDIIHPRIDVTIILSPIKSTKLKKIIYDRARYICGPFVSWNTNDMIIHAIQEVDKSFIEPKKDDYLGAYKISAESLKYFNHIIPPEFIQNHPQGFKYILFCDLQQKKQIRAILKCRKISHRLIK